MNTLFRSLAMLSTVCLLTAPSIYAKPPHPKPPRAQAVESAIDNSIVEVFSYLKVPDGTYAIYQGTGWFGNRTMLITDFHVIKGANHIMIVYPDGQKRWATVRTWNEACDLAILEVQNPRADQNWLTLIADSDTIPKSFSVYTTSYQTDHPMTTYGTLTVFLNSDNQSSIAMFGSNDLRSGPGGSGAPVIDTDGQVIGMIEGGNNNPNKPYEVFIISANVIWEGLQITGRAHPVGFVKGVTNGLNFGQYFQD